LFVDVSFRPHPIARSSLRLSPSTQWRVLSQTSIVSQTLQVR
jgi:hypothetical protein